MSKRKEPSSPTEAPGSKSARSAFEDEERALRSEIRTIEERQAKLEEEKANFESEHRAEYDRMMSELRDKESHFKSKWRREMEPVEKALDKAQDRLDQLWERRTRPLTGENASRLDKLPQELWEKIFREFEDADLFPLALSCKFFRYKQKELVAQKKELRMRTVLEKDNPHLSLSREYLIFACASALEAREGLGTQSIFMKIAWYREDYKLMKDMGLCEMDYDGYCTILSEFNCEWSGGASYDGVADLEYLKFLNENRHPASPSCPGWSENCTQVAAGCGRLDILKYAKENGIPLCNNGSDMDPSSSAAYGGQLEVLQWLRENDCPWDALTCARAVRQGHFVILRWALENGCPWDVDYTYRLACQRYDPQDYDPQDYEMFSEHHEHMNIEWSKIRDWIDSTGRTLYADQDVPGTLYER